jgi:hypothetical protein
VEREPRRRRDALDLVIPERGPAEREELALEVGGARRPVARIQRHRLQDQPLEPLGNLWALLARLLVLGRQHPEHELVVVLALDRHAADQHLVEDHAERVEVRSRPHLALAARLLRGHIVRRAQDEPRLRQPELALEARGAGDPEVEELHDLAAALPHEVHVVRLEIAVDDARLVRGGERREDRAAQLAGDLDGESAARAKPRCQRLALEVLHDEERLALVARPEIGDLRDPLVPDLRGRDRLAVEPLDHSLRAGLRVQDLDRDALAQRGVGTQVDGAHAAHGEQLLDPILVIELRARWQLPGPRVLHGRRISHPGPKFTPDDDPCDRRAGRRTRPGTLARQRLPRRRSTGRPANRCGEISTTLR